MLTVTHNATSVNPALVLPYAYERPLNNIEHDIIGSATKAFTFRPAGPRSGTLVFLCLTADDAQQLVTMHADAGLFDIIDSDVPAAAMTYVPVGKMSMTLDPVTATRWVCSIEFREVG